MVHVVVPIQTHSLCPELGSIPGEVPVAERHRRIDHLQRSLRPEIHGGVCDVVLQPSVEAEFLQERERERREGGVLAIASRNRRMLILAVVEAERGSRAHKATGTKRCLSEPKQSRLRLVFSMPRRRNGAGHWTTERCNPANFRFLLYLAHHPPGRCAQLQAHTYQVKRSR